MKKLLSLLMAAAMSFSLAACGSNDTAPTPTPAPTPVPVAVPAPTPVPPTPAPVSPTPELPDTYKVAMITDFGDITDQSFNQTTYEACKDFCEANQIGFKYFRPVGNSTTERIAQVDAAIAEDFNVIVLPGYAFAGTIIEASKRYPEAMFFALDIGVGDLLSAAVGESYTNNPADYDVTRYYNAANVYCVSYQEELSGYMAGYAAVKLGYRHLGFLGGAEAPAIVRYGYGFVQGANAAAEALAISGEVTVEYIYAGRFDAAPAITSGMDNWYQNLGVEAVFTCGGTIYTSAAEAAARTGGKIIGVDVDQAAIIDAAYGAGMTLTSAMKGLAPTVKDTLTEIILKNNWKLYSGTFATLGLVSGDEPASNYLQLPLESTQWAEGKFTQEDYKALVKSIFDGTTPVSGDISAAPATAITVHYHGTIK